MFRWFIVAFWGAMWGLSVQAHPMDATEFSLRSSVSLSDAELMVVVVLEVPLNDVVVEFARMYPDRNQVSEDDIEAFKEMQWKRLTDGLALKINSETREVTWSPLGSPINGRASEGFFVYMVGGRVVPSEGGFSSPLVVELDNQAHIEASMVLSAYAAGAAPWIVLENNALDVLGSRAEMVDVSEDPLGWTRDPALRNLRIVFQR